MNRAEATSHDRDDRSWIILSGSLLAVGAVVYVAVALPHRDRLKAVNVATIVSIVSAMASMLLIQRGIKRGPDAIAGTFVTSWLLRSAISIGGCVAGIVWLHVSPVATLLTMTVYYFATLAAETYIAAQRLKTIQKVS